MHSYFTVIGLGVQWLRVDSRLSCDQYFGYNIEPPPWPPRKLPVSDGYHKPGPEHAGYWVMILIRHPIRLPIGQDMHQLC